ncbi:hypothetical protein FA13DRAFT_1743031 [Coprinellus micaceus]|uniref:Uncharacterized protein n=1 Tax=Coprinellus micaceus TaxID=71717 RepID=A0A4Y7SF14_COPMI|nr:hypothetical protein FA13DRAFT_1743031 [Coprinellus micaceus]
MAYTSNPQLDQVYLLAAIWAERFTHCGSGFYVCLFIMGMLILTKPPPVNSPRERTSTASRVFFGALWLMFLTATFHIIVQMYRLIRAYGFILSEDATPIGYFHKSPLGWDAISNPILMGFQIWVGDALAIYRCYIIWGHNFWVIVVPVLLAARGRVNLTLYSWFPKPWTPYEKLIGVINAGYPLAFAQNVLTTSLIAWKIWRQHCASQQSGLKAANNISLIQVIRIIVESAMVYTLQVFILNFVFQSITVPAAGIVFVLIAIRVHVAKSESSEQYSSLVSHSPLALRRRPCVRFGTHRTARRTLRLPATIRPFQFLTQRKPTNGLFIQPEVGPGESEPKTGAA